LTTLFGYQLLYIELMRVNGKAFQLHAVYKTLVRIHIRYCKSCALRLNVQWNRRFIW